MNDVQALPVIIVHGLWVHGLVMEYLAHQLQQDGFDAHTWSYPTMRQTLSENADHLAAYCNSLGLQRLNIVAHSMGGLVAMKMLERTPAIQCERLLLIGTPVHRQRRGAPARAISRRRLAARTQHPRMAG
jgi:pimeloyl-ACP methyl ester carboxylesterase